MKMLEVRNLKKSFGDVQVLDGVSFSVERGEAVDEDNLPALAEHGCLRAESIEETALEALAGAVQNTLRAAGFPIERRVWKPHVTLVRRWRGPVPETQVSPAAMTAERISLMRSDRVDGRLIYTEVFSVRL